MCIQIHVIITHAQSCTKKNKELKKDKEKQRVEMGSRGWGSAVTTILYTLHPYSGGWWRLELHPADGGRSPPLCGDAKVSPLPHLCGVEIHHYKLKGAVGGGSTSAHLYRSGDPSPQRGSGRSPHRG
jgi:hypothetical protein